MPSKILGKLSVGSEVGVLIHGYITVKSRITIKLFLYFSPSGGNTKFYTENIFYISQPFESDCAGLNGHYHTRDFIYYEK
jgi:hypothetical protein